MRFALCVRWFAPTIFQPEPGTQEQDGSSVCKMPDNLAALEINPAGAPLCNYKSPSASITAVLSPIAEFGTVIVALALLSFHKSAIIALTNVAI